MRRGRGREAGPIVPIITSRLRLPQAQRHQVPQFAAGAEPIKLEKECPGRRTAAPLYCCGECHAASLLSGDGNFHLHLWGGMPGGGSVRARRGKAGGHASRRIHRGSGQASTRNVSAGMGSVEPAGHRGSRGAVFHGDAAGMKGSIGITPSVTVNFRQLLGAYAPLPDSYPFQ